MVRAMVRSSGGLRAQRRRKRTPPEVEISHLAPGVPVPAREQLPSPLTTPHSPHLSKHPCFYVAQLVSPSLWAHRIQAACYPAELGTGILLGDFPVAEVLCSDALGPSEPASPQLPTPAPEVPVSVRLQPTSYRKSAFLFLPRARGRGKPPTPLHARTHTPPDTSQYPPLAEPAPSPSAPQDHSPGTLPTSRIPASEQRWGRGWRAE